METEIVTALVGVVGIFLGSLVTQMFTRRKTDAEIDKIKAETEKARIEADKLKAEILQLTIPDSNGVEFQKIEKNDTKLNIPSDINATEINKYKRRPTPDEIKKEVDKLPEYQKEFALRSYEGLLIKWHLKLLSLATDGDIVELGLVPNEDSFLPVLCKVKLSDYPEIKLLKSDDELWVSGKISKIHHPLYAISLSDCLLEFD